MRSVVGRFLEHSRVYWFGNGGKPETFCSSADWMERNLLRRIETCFPILDPELAQRVFDEELANYLRDNQQAWRLHAGWPLFAHRAGKGRGALLGAGRAAAEAGAVSAKRAAARDTLPEGELLAAVDLGSNSFHMVVARSVLGQLRIVDRIKEHVRLAEGLDGERRTEPKRR